MKELEFTTRVAPWRGRDMVAIDCDPAVARLTLSHHWNGDATPPEYRHDLASGAAFRWAKDPARDDRMRGADHVYNDHYDVDGFLAAYIVLHPDDALRDEALILDAAAAGDFDEWPNDDAVRFAMWGETLEHEGDSWGSRSGTLYEKILPEIPDALRDPDALEGAWRSRWEGLKTQRRLFPNKARVTEHAHHLSVIEAPRFVSSRVAVAETQGHRILQAADAGEGWLYAMRYRPHLGYRVIDRALTPVHDPARLAAGLNRVWPHGDGTWEPRGWWLKELRLKAQGGGSHIARTSPEEAALLFAATLGALDVAPTAGPERRAMAT